MTQNTNFFISANQLFCSKSNILDHVSQSQDCVHHKDVLDSCCNNPSEVIFNRTHSAARPWTGRGFILNPHFHFSCKYIITLCTLVCKTHCCVLQVCVQDFCEELEYWGLNDLHLEPCCQHTYYRARWLLPRKQEVGHRSLIIVIFLTEFNPTPSVMI